ncbi:enhanced intracellular survival protein Eis [Streptomyces jumonjinensis]|uniref:enhanced intracellular survival protein Eis n=1 Tax=Streptomyces jumonjinensis TaxID=1945 RepID=UPI00379521EC
MSDLDAGPLRDHEFDEAVALLAYSFGTAAEAHAQLEGLPPEQIFAVRRAEGLAAIGRWESAEVSLHGLPTSIAVKGLVTTHPALRRRGMITPYAEPMMGLLREQGHVLAGWKTAIPRWWRAMGWGPCAAVSRYTGTPGLLRPTHDPALGGPELGPDPEDLLPVHRAFAARRFGPLLRDVDDWHALLRPEPADVRRDTVLWRGPQGTPEGYARYRHTRSGAVTANRYEGLELVVDELAALTPGAYLGLLGFLADHTTVPAFRWDAPADDPLPSVIREPRDLQPRTVVGGRILRVVDMSRLTLPAGGAAAGAADGLLLSVADELCAWNRGPWRAHRDGEVFRFVREPGSPESAVQVAAHAWGPLIARYLPVDHALLCGLLFPPAPTDRDRLAALLPPTPAPYCPDEW